MRRSHSVLHAALDRAVRWGMTSLNPADRATAPGLARTTVSAPEVTEVQRLVAAAELSSPTLVALAIVLGAVTGARRGELCALRWSDVDWQRCLLTIARNLTEIDGVASEGPTKSHQRRDIALDDALLGLLTKRRADQEAYAAVVGTTLVTDAFHGQGPGKKTLQVPGPPTCRTRAANPRESRWAAWSSPPTPSIATTYWTTIPD